ncbi:Uu.00g140700.m01.CDS01 [Anthostomella pinea]|uniref:Uu.00g140700.m01.CDS01 n=1 Tax=Anthostomella pinea TaxID=933095 RepID=A0AAI8VQY4_9PEZI|nr:Uu.00g140700.m01.CDS01 [Anthostomella pinea]
MKVRGGSSSIESGVACDTATDMAGPTSKLRRRTPPVCIAIKFGLPTLRTMSTPAAAPRVIFRNDAFQTFVDTMAVGASSAFESWLPTVIGLTATPASNAMLAGVFGSRNWTGKSLSCGWTVVYCTQKDWITSAHRAQDNSAVSVNLEMGDDDDLTLPQRPITCFPVDWTLYPMLARDPWVTYLLDEHDWNNTKMGHPTTWTDMDLRAHVIGIMANPEPRWIFWGTEFNMMYNAACVPRLGAMHPKALDNPIANWGQGLHDHHYGQIRHTIKTGMASIMRDVPLLSNAANATTGATWTEESFHDFTFTPVPDASGHCSSFLFEYADTTA